VGKAIFSRVGKDVARGLRKNDLGTGRFNLVGNDTSFDQFYWPCL
jgi:hypothetical protein